MSPDERDDVYRPPRAALVSAARDRGDQFYVVSRRKLTILFLGTVSLYTVYWFWRNWRHVKATLDDSVWPIPRAIFYIFFTHSLLRRVDGVLRERQRPHDWSPSKVASTLVLLTILSNVVDRLAARGFGSPQTDIAAVLLVPVLLPVLLQAQAAINVSQGDPDGRRNDRLTLANYLWIGLGGLLWLTIGFGFAVMLGLVPA